MWGGPEPEPHKGEPSSQQQVEELKDQNEQQLLLIAQLKEMLRKEQSSVSQEKVEEYVYTLSKARAKKSRQKQDETGANQSTKAVTVNIDSNKKERINLLRQQLEENKARLAKRGKSQKGIEKMVTEVQTQLNDSHQFTGPLNVSLVEPRNINYNEDTPQKELYNILITKERKVLELITRSHKLESSVMDLQENVKEKESVIDARTKAITLMTDSLSKKGKRTLDDLEETKEQMRKMQENFVTLEADMKARQSTLLNDLKSKNKEISNLQEINKKLQTRLSATKRDIVDSGEILEGLPDDLINSKTHITQLLSRIKELENEIESIKYSTTATNSLGHFESELLIKSQIKNNELLSKISDLEMQIESLKLKHAQSNVLELESSKKIGGLENQLSEKNELLKSKLSEKKILDDLENSKAENKILLQKIANLERGHKQHLLDDLEVKNRLDESYKDIANILQSVQIELEETKTKLKEYESHPEPEYFEILKYQDEITNLKNQNFKITQQVDEALAELNRFKCSTTRNEGDNKEIEKLKKQLDESNKGMIKMRAPQQELLSAKHELTETVMSKHVSSEISSIQFEEEVEKLEAEKRALQKDLDYVQKEKNALLEEIELLKNEKQDFSIKLENYIQENMELMDKLEKLSTEKVSSAESIEIVEGLTQQEKLELAAYQKIIGQEEVIKCIEDDHMDPPVELNESVLQLSEETTELLQKIEMFTRERKEVMQKMDSLKEENYSLYNKIKEIENHRDILAETYEQLQNEKEAVIIKNLELEAKLSLSDKSLSGVNDLQQKNKDQSEKLKKLAANLKKKTQSYQDLEKQYNIEKEKWKLEAHEKEIVISNYQRDIEHISTNLQVIKSHVDEKDIQIELLLAQIRAIEQTSLNEKEAEFKEVSLQTEMSANSYEEISKQNTSQQLILEKKIRELELILEIQQSDIEHNVEKIEMLEDNLQKIDKENSGLVSRNLELEDILSSTSNNLKENALLKDQLELKLAEAFSNDEVLNKKLFETITQNKELVKKNIENQKLIKKLKTKLKKSHDQDNELRSRQETIEELENINNELKKQMSSLEATNRDLQSENVLQQRHLSDYEKIEVDYQTQLEELLEVKNDLTVKCEILQKKIKEFEEKEEEFIMEIEEYRLRVLETNASTDEVNRLKLELETVNGKLHEALSKISILSAEVSTLMNEIDVVRTAKFIVDEIVDAVGQQVNPLPGEQQHSLVEIVSKPHQACLCYVKDDKQQSLDAFEENDDGWGWGPEEGRLEEEHISKLEHIPQVKNMQLEIENLKECIKVLEMERERHMYEIKHLQVKSGKLIKKCKELKLKFEQLSPGSSSIKPDDGVFIDLNKTIQDELNQQVQKLENKIKNISAELTKERAANHRLLKQVDVLTSANDRMGEIKEIQDAEVHRWQRKYQDAQFKLEQYDWSVSGSQKDINPVKSSSSAALDDVKELELEQIINKLHNEKIVWEATEIQLNNIIIQKEKNIEELTSELQQRDIEDQQLINQDQQTLHDELAKKEAELGKKNREITGLNQAIEDVKKELSIVYEKDAQMAELASLVDQISVEKVVLSQELQKIQSEHSNCQSVHSDNIERLDRLQTEYHSLEERLQAKEKIITELNSRIFDILEATTNDSNKEIQRLSSERQQTKQEPMEQSQEYTEEDLSEQVRRAELDLALYMLHQRDVRCEELTVELTHLLEERDTLQLKLSNAIREKEVLRSKSHLDIASSILPESGPSDVSALILATTATELVENTSQNDVHLATKLSELKNVGYKKDKTFVDEQDARRLQQMTIMQQHIKDTSKLPPEAAAKLTNANYTLSRDVQSSSKVLLNWLWGNSTPKSES